MGFPWIREKNLSSESISSCADFCDRSFIIAVSIELSIALSNAFERRANSRGRVEAKSSNLSGIYSAFRLVPSLEPSFTVGGPINMRHRPLFSRLPDMSFFQGSAGRATYSEKAY
jgi:hypothetical protein